MPQLFGNLQVGKVKQNYQRPCKFKKLAVLQPDTVGYFKTTARIISITKFARCVRDRNDSKQFGLAHAPQAVSFVPRVMCFQVGNIGNCSNSCVFSPKQVNKLPHWGGEFVYPNEKPEICVLQHQPRNSLFSTSNFAVFLQMLNNDLAPPPVVFALKQKKRAC